MSDNKLISAAFVKAQSAFGPALKDKTNPAFRSKYADLGACLDAVMDALNANGIALMQRNHPQDGGVCIETIFIHESGEQLSAGLLTVPATKQDAQGYGSAMTYARRYSVMSACGIAPEDDDGNAAVKKGSPAKPDVSHSGPAIAFAGLSPDWQTWIDAFARDVENTFASSPQAAAALIAETTEKEQLEPEHIAAMWAKLGSKTRSALKALPAK